MPPEGAIDEFANTFREWHYLVSGLAAGFAAGVYITVKYYHKIHE